MKTNVMILAMLTASASFLVSCVSKPKSTQNEKNVTKLAYHDVPASPLEKPGYVLDFSEEFNNSELNTEVWYTKYFDYLPAASDSGANATYTLKDGIFHLTINEDTKTWSENDTVNHWQVSSIQTYVKNYLHAPKVTELKHSIKEFEGYTVKYGYFEMRAKLPDCGDGSHFAWWLIGCQDDAELFDQSSETGEIDIVEAPLYNCRNSKPQLHPNTDKRIIPWRNDVCNPGEPTKEYHLYAMDWSPEGLKFYYDNELIGETNSAPTYRMCMFLSLYSSNKGTSWTKPSKGIYPKVVSIDYVRVWKQKSGYTEKK